MKKILSSFLCALIVFLSVAALGAETDAAVSKVLISHEDYIVRSVWKNGDDMRVCIETEQGLQWYSFSDGILVGAADEPEGFTLANAWDDIEEYMLGEGSNTNVYYTLELSNRYPWLITWNGYRLRRMTSRQGGEQLWLTSPGREPRVLAEGNYSRLMVVPGTDYAVVSKRIIGGEIIVKIDLNTGEESVLWPEPAQYNTPFLMLGGKLLIVQGASGLRYLWDPETGEIDPVPEDFPQIYVGTYYRYFQPTDCENLYYFTDTDTRGGTTLGVLDTVNMVFTPMMVFERMYLPPMDVWVDEENACLYSVSDGDLLEIPFSLAKPKSEFIKVSVNGWMLDFTGIVTDDGRTHVDLTDNNLGSLGCITAMRSDSDTSFIIRNNKVLILENGRDYMTEVDISGFNNLFTLSVDLLSGNPYEKSFVRKIPLDTCVIRDYAPLRAICEAFGAEVTWNETDGRIDIFIDTWNVERPANEYVISLLNLLLQVDEWDGSAPGYNN